MSLDAAHVRTTNDAREMHDNDHFHVGVISPPTATIRNPPPRKKYVGCEFNHRFWHSKVDTFTFFVSLDTHQAICLGSCTRFCVLTIHP